MLCRSPYWDMTKKQRLGKKFRILRDPVVPAFAAMLITIVLALVDNAYVDIIDGAELKLAK
jgi:hypothetical protein